jgi:hypothetical protein
MMAQRIVRLGLVAVALVSASCGSVVRQGTGTSYLIINELAFARGDEPDTFVANAISDVNGPNETNFNDLARATFSLGLKDPGAPGAPSAPTPNQFITIDRYHVRFFRADGRDKQGVDVPYEFDGAFTVTVGAGTVEAPFTVVRHDAKREAPLGTLGVNGIVLTIMAEITFYGRDQTGHQVVASAKASIDFGNFVFTD